MILQKSSVWAASREFLLEKARSSYVSRCIGKHAASLSDHKPFNQLLSNPPNWRTTINEDNGQQNRPDEFISRSP